MVSVSFGQNWCGEGSDVTSLSTHPLCTTGRLKDEADEDIPDDDEAGSTDEGTEESFDDENTGD